MIIELTLKEYLIEVEKRILDRFAAHPTADFYGFCLPPTQDNTGSYETVNIENPHDH